MFKSIIMELTLTKKTKIKEVKKQFAALFPFLKLEFFRHRHGQGESSILAHMFPESTPLSNVSDVMKEGTFAFDPATTVAAFEQQLQNEHSLPVQVFRKAGNLWLETVQTDNLTLARQNSMGEDSSRPVQFNRYTLFL
jgi:hypothetical protein